MLQVALVRQKFSMFAMKIGLRDISNLLKCNKKVTLFLLQLMALALTFKLNGLSAAYYFIL